MHRLKQGYKLYMVKVLYTFLLFLGISISIQAQFQFMYASGNDDIALRYLHVSKDENMDTIVIAPGKSGIIEVYKYMIDYLVAQGFDVWIMEWRGTGGSSRVLENTQKTHIDSYKTYLKDFDEFINRVVIPNKKPGKLMILGVSKGGNIATRYMLSDEYQNSEVDGMVLLAPMFDIYTGKYPRHLADAISDVFINMDYNDEYVFGYGDYDPEKNVFEDNKYTSDPKRHAITKKIYIENPHLVTEGPTFNWVNETLKTIRYLRRYRGEKLKIPTMVINAKHDRVVRSAIDHKVCARVGCTEMKTYDDSKHEIFNESPKIMTRLMGDIYQFYLDRVQ